MTGTTVISGLLWAYLKMCLPERQQQKFNMGLGDVDGFHENNATNNNNKPQK